MNTQNRRVRDMVALSRRLGADPLVAQAAGGNVSAKLDADSMAIKASGFRLREIRASKGWARADVAGIRGGARRLSQKKSSAATELAYADLLKQSAPRPGPSISMEAGLHAALPDTYVAHTHSIAGIVLGLMPPRLADRCIQAFCGRVSSVRRIPPRLPGFELTLDLMKATARPHGALTLWILKNHGLVWSGGAMEDLWRASAALEKGMRPVLEFARFPPAHALGSKSCKAPAARASMDARSALDLCWCHWDVCDFDFKPLFPDLVIYFDLYSRRAPDLIRLSERAVRILGKDAAALRDKREVLFAHVLASTLLALGGWRKPLPAAMGRAIRNLETERRRLAQMARA